ncbi:MAG: Transcriptional regulator [Rhodobacteraceae bacterium HLUCCA12]|nr:MAG: Transcriptional regulator [Rhodobacteraceae bacterium HLUCCA12]
MTLEQLRIFLKVAELQHVTRAAEALNMTQSAVSAAVSGLEQRHGVALFDRVGRGIVLTESGRRFVPHARRVVQRATEAEAFLIDLERDIAGTLRIQASQTVASYFLPGYLMRFQANYPKVVVKFAQGNTASVLEAVISGAADIGVVEGYVSNPAIEVRPVADDRMCLLVGRAHPWADRCALSATDLAQANWVMRERGSGTRAAFDEAMTALGVCAADLSVLLELPSNEACIAAVQAGIGATALSQRAARHHIAQAVVSEAGFTLPARDFSVIRHRERHQSRAAQAFSALVSNDMNS